MFAAPVFGAAHAAPLHAMAHDRPYVPGHDRPSGNGIRPPSPPVQPARGGGWRGPEGRVVLAMPPGAVQVLRHFLVLPLHLAVAEEPVPSRQDVFSQLVDLPGTA